MQPTNYRMPKKHLCTKLEDETTILYVKLYATTLHVNTFARNGRWDYHPASEHVRHHFTCQVMYHVSKTLFANQDLSSTNLWYSSLVCTTKIDFPLPNDQSFHDSSTTNFGIRKIKLGNASIDCQKYPYPRGIWNLFLIVQKAIIVLLDSKIPCSMVTKPNLAIQLNYEFRLPFPSQCNILEATNAFVAKEWVSFLHSRAYI